MSIEKEVIESARPMSESSLWAYMRAFYQELGPRSWGERVVPFRSTTSPQLANAYVRAVAAYLSDLERLGALDPSVPVDIVELGVGSGATALYFLLEWFADGARPHPQPIRYVATDLAAKNLESLKKHPALKPFIDDGVFHTALFDAEQPKALAIGDSSVFGGPRKAPTVVIANYVIDSLTSRAFAFKDGTLEEWHIALERAVGYVPPETEQDPIVRRFRQCEARFTRVPVSTPSFDQPEIDAVFADHLKGSASFVFPVSGLRLFDWLKKNSGPLLTLITDKGFHRPNAHPQEQTPFVQEHGSYSVDVNFFALARFGVENNAFTWLSPRRHFPLFYLAEAFGHPPAVYTALHWTLKDTLERYSIGDAHVLTQAEFEALLQDDPQLSYAAILAKLRAACFDTYAYLHLVPALNTVSLKLKPNANMLHDLTLALNEVLRRAHPALVAVDIPGSVASHLAQIGAYEDALGAYAQSLAGRGHKAWRSLFGSAICLVQLDQGSAAREAWGVLDIIPIAVGEQPEYDMLKNTLFNAAKARNITLSA